MKDEFQTYSQIDRYLNKEMAPDEQLAFEEAMEKNPELASEVQEMKLVNDTIFYSNLSDLKETMKADLGKSKKPFSDFNSKKIISGVVLLAGISGLGYYLLSENPKEKEIPTEVIVNDSSDVVKEEETVVPTKTEPIQPENKTPEKKVSIQPSSQPENTVENNGLTEKSAEPIVTDSAKAQNSVPKAVNPDTASVSLPKIKTEKPAENKPVSTQVIDKPVIPCNKTFEINASATCEGKSGGEISVSPNEKGTFVFQIKDLENNNSGNFYNLSSGKYNLIIKDSACTYTQTVNVPEKWCPQNTAYSFNPEFGETWELKHDLEDKGNFVVYNSLGKEIYRSNFGNGYGSWDGTDRDGNLVDLGLYYAIIEYSDNRIEKVELTIIRK